MQEKRLTEIITIMRDIKRLGFPDDYPPMKELSLRMNDYLRTGQGWSGKIKFQAYERIADIILPENPRIPIQVVLRYHKF